MNQPLDSPHTALRRQVLATRCLCCGKALCDAESVTLGLGPICRKRHGLTDSLRARPTANELVARAAIAAEEGQLTTVLECLKALVALDPCYQTLVDRTHDRLFKTRISTVPNGYLVSSTFNRDTVDQFRNLGMRWDRVRRGWTAFSTEQLDEALNILGHTNPGNEALGPDGEVIVLIEGYRV